MTVHSFAYLGLYNRFLIVTVAFIESAFAQHSSFSSSRRFPTPLRLTEFVVVVGGYKNEDFKDLREEFQVC